MECRLRRPRHYLSDRSSNGGCNKKFSASFPLDPQNLGKYLWVAGQAGNTLYQIDPETGTVIRSFASPAGTPFGLTFDGKYLWNDDAGTDLIYQIDPVTGMVLRSFATPGQGFASGLAWDGKYLWHCDLGGAVDTIYQIDPVTGAVINSFASPFIIPSGLAFDGKYLWHCDYSADLIYQLSLV